MNGTKESDGRRPYTRISVCQAALDVVNVRLDVDLQTKLLEGTVEPGQRFLLNTGTLVLLC